MLSNIARLYSASKLTTVAGVSSPSTVIDFLSFMRNAYLIDSIGLYDHSLKVTARNPRKVYACDTGLASSVSLSHSPDVGRYLENIVFISLRHQYASDHIYYYAQRGECDFVVTGADNRPEMLIQVCHELNDENFDREMNGLTEAMTALHLDHGVIVTRDEEDHFETAAGSVDVVKAWKWLV
jgi:predicted AAA+ superfamily ATPase